MMIIEKKTYVKIQIRKPTKQYAIIFDSLDELGYNSIKIVHWCT